MSLWKNVLVGALCAAGGFAVGHHFGFDAGGKSGFAVGMEAGETLWSRWLSERFPDDCDEMCESVRDYERHLQFDEDGRDDAVEFMYTCLLGISKDGWNALPFEERMHLAVGLDERLEKLHANRLWTAMQ